MGARGGLHLEPAEGERSIGRPKEAAPDGDVADETRPVSAAEVKLLSLAEAIERVDPALREAMSERLRAEFRQVVRWEAPKAVDRPDVGGMIPDSEGLSDLTEEEESES